ncbi:AAA and adenylate/guanylate cyclase domain-containing protein [Yoonia sediminilitoris]|nr:AAA and adenylate/guanylate cyclase domain-containing protein [Yoonia sediminilitoris]
MYASTQENVFEALSFLSAELRAALAVAPDGTTCGALPPRKVALLWSDIAGFSRHTHMFLSAGSEGVDRLHREINAHYDQLIETILSHGGEPVTFVGDGLLSVWPVDNGGMAQAVARAANTANALVRKRENGDSHFDLNHHIACGDIQTVELGGRNGRWLTTSVGSALKELEQIATIKQPNQIFLTATAASLCPADTVSEVIGGKSAHRLLGDIPFVSAERTVLAVPPATAWDATVARMPRFAQGWIETVGLKYLAELRPVTSVSVVLHGFDQSTGEGAARLDQIVQSVQEIVHGRDGYVAEVIVDDKGVSILVTFGTPPDAHSDDPLRSVLSARDILAALRQRGVQSSIGVATGRMLCCIVGNKDRRCDLVLGDALIRSTRLAGATEDGILIDKNTMRATQDRVAIAADPMMLLFKGAQTPAPVWALEDEQRPAESTHNIQGRASEKELLLRCWSHATSGIYGTNVVVEGESGVGKTSLALNLRDHVTASGGNFRIVAASAIEQASPYSALRSLFLDVLGVLPLMTAQKRQGTILSRLPYDLRERAPFLNALFPTGLDETPVTQDAIGRARAAHIQSYVVDVLCHALADTPSCLCVDDAQWLDDESGQVLARLAEALPSLMIVVLTQPTADNRWQDFAQNAGFAHLPLGPLTRAGLKELVLRCLDCETVDAALFDRIEKLTERHAFYCVELLRSLVEKKAITQHAGKATLADAAALDAASLPDTMHGMVLQRLDRLDPAEQLSLRVASVAGLVFPTQLVCDIHPVAEPDVAIAAQLKQQVSNGFLRTQDQGENLGYAFSHSIVREVAHSQLPAQQSRGLHAKAAQWIEENAAEDRASRMLELAHHWEQAGAKDRAVGYMIEEAQRLFGQGFAIDAVKVGLRAMRTAGVDVPEGTAALGQGIEENIAEIERLTAGRHPTELLSGLQPPSDDLALRFLAILPTAPLAFQSNQFEIFAWAATSAMRLVMENQSGPPHAFAIYSIVRALLTQDKVAGAAWSRAALDLDAVTGGTALPAVAFIDTWFHGHWRVPMAESIAINRAARKMDVAPQDQQYASYNIAGAVILRAATGHPLADVVDQAQRALTTALYRNARMHTVLEMQFARALQSKTDNPLSLSDHAIDEDKDIGWVAETEFANQSAFYLATRVRLHRYAGDWEGALAWYDRACEMGGAIAGQMIECDLVLHGLLARFGAVLSDNSSLSAHTDPIQKAIAMLEEWHVIQPDNFGAKAQMSKLIWAGFNGDTSAAAALSDLADSLGPDQWLQDRALALEYAARLDLVTARKQAAIAAYETWGATAVAARLRDAWL